MSRLSSGNLALTWLLCVLTTWSLSCKGIGTPPVDEARLKEDLLLELERGESTPNFWVDVGSIVEEMVTVVGVSSVTITDRRTDGTGGTDTIEFDFTITGSAHAPLRMTQHLAILKKGEEIKARCQGAEVYYSLYDQGWRADWWDNLKQDCTQI